MGRLVLWICRRSLRGIGRRSRNGMRLPWCCFDVSCFNLLVYAWKGLGDARNVLLVNNHGHSVLAMLSLRTIQPHGLCVVDHDSVCRCHGCGRRHRHISRAETSDVAVLCDGRTWVIECRLGDGMICGCELELNHVPLRSNEVVRIVGQTAVHASHSYYVDLDILSCKSLVFLLIARSIWSWTYPELRPRSGRKGRLL